MDTGSIHSLFLHSLYATLIVACGLRELRDLKLGSKIEDYIKKVLDLVQ
jgi:hypothetical protein